MYQTSYLRLAAAAFTALGIATTATAGEKVPFRGRLEGVASTVSFNFPIACGVTNGAGNATHLGQFAFEHPHCANIQNSTLTGKFRFIAANGDEIFADFSGQSSVTPLPGIRIVVGTANITGGTGRFSGASGGFALQRLFNSLSNTTVGSFEGTLSSPGALSTPGVSNQSRHKTAAVPAADRPSRTAAAPVAIRL